MASNIRPIQLTATRRRVMPELLENWSEITTKPIKNKAPPTTTRANAFNSLTVS
jgi:hypothetical protein